MLFLNGPSPASFSFIWDLFKQTMQQIIVKKCHIQPVYGAGIWTHNLSNMSRLLKPLDQGSRPNTKSCLARRIILTRVHGDKVLTKEEIFAAIVFRLKIYSNRDSNIVSLDIKFTSNPCVIKIRGFGGTITKRLLILHSANPYRF